jgi:hypothetical protein
MKWGVLFTVFSVVGFAFNAQATTRSEAEAAQDEADDAESAMRQKREEAYAQKAELIQKHNKMKDRLDKLKKAGDPCGTGAPASDLGQIERNLATLLLTVELSRLDFDAASERYDAGWRLYSSGWDELYRKYNYENAKARFGDAKYEYNRANRMYDRIKRGFSQQTEIARAIDDALKAAEMWLKQREMECPKGISEIIEEPLDAPDMSPGSGS